MHTITKQRDFNKFHQKYGWFSFGGADDSQEDVDAPSAL